MMTLTIESHIIEDYLKVDCHNDKNEFITKIEDLVENQRIKDSLTRGLKEAKLQREGKIVEKDISELLDKLS